MKRQIIKKWFWVWDFDREEAWLNDMAQSGWVLDKVGFAKYEFVQCQPASESSVLPHKVQRLLSVQPIK